MLDTSHPVCLPWHHVSPIVSFANFMHCHAGETFGPRIIGDYQIIYVTSGKGRVTIQGNEYAACTGDLFYYGPEVAHLIIADEEEPFSLYGVHFNWSTELVPLDRRMMPHITYVDDHYQTNKDNRICLGEDLQRALVLSDLQKFPTQGLIPYFERLVRAYGSNEAYAPLQLRAYLIELFVSMHQAGQAPALSPETANPLVLAVAGGLNQRVRERYDRKWLGQWTAYHPDHVSRLFREHTGLTPYEYFMQRKIELVKELLASTDESLLAIAHDVQAGSIHSFTKWFTNWTGISPGRYRKRSRII